MTDTPSVSCDLCVIGSGMAGMSAALFAAQQGLSTVMVGRTGEIIFATGLLDLMAVHPVEKGAIWDDPWAGIAQLAKDLPQHPYARLPAATIRTAFDALIAFLESMRLPYAGHPDRNSQVLTSVGTFKPTYRVPLTMWAGIEVWRRKAPCLLVDIQGLKGFSALQIAAMVGPDWPGLRTVRIGFPGPALSGEVFPERLARSLEAAANREKLAAAIQPRLQGGRSRRAAGHSRHIQPGGGHGQFSAPAGGDGFRNPHHAARRDRAPAQGGLRARAEKSRGAAFSRKQGLSCRCGPQGRLSAACRAHGPRRGD